MVEVAVRRLPRGIRDVVEVAVRRLPRGIRDVVEVAVCREVSVMWWRLPSAERYP